MRLLTALDRAGVLTYRYCTPLPGARYVVSLDGRERELGPGDVVPYVAGLADGPGGERAAAALATLAEVAA